MRAQAPFLMRTVERLSGRGPHVEDIVQDVFVVAHRRADRWCALDDDGQRAFLYGVARHKVHHHRRFYARFQRLRDAVLGEPAREQPTVELTAERQHTAQLVRATIATLPFASQEVFVLHALEGLDAAAVAKLLDIPEGTVWSRLSTARARFKAAYLDRLARPAPHERDTGTASTPRSITLGGVV
jgi:RNA polymerase sigma-70 factor (ECF subfamily)